MWWKKRTELRKVAKVAIRIVEPFSSSMGYEVKCQHSSMFTSTQHRQLDPQEPSRLHPDLTAKESLDLRVAEDRARKRRWGVSVMESIELKNWKDSAKVASRMLDEIAQRNDLRFVSQPTWETLGFKESIRKDVEREMSGLRRYHVGLPVKINPDYLASWPLIDATADTVKEGDVISLRHDDIVYPLLKVLGRRGKLFIDSSHLPIPGNRILLSDLPASKCELVSVRRLHLKLDPYSPTALGGKGLVGVDDLVEERQHLWARYQSEKSYLDRGGMMLDQWEADAYEMNKERLREVERQLDAALGRF